MAYRPASAIGKALQAAADADAARTVIGAGTSSLVIGTTATTAKAGNYQPAAANITDSSVVGRALLTAADAAAARLAIGAGTSSLVLGTTAPARSSSTRTTPRWRGRASTAPSSPAPRRPSRPARRR